MKGEIFDYLGAVLVSVRHLVKAPQGGVGAPAEVEIKIAEPYLHPLKLQFLARLYQAMMMRVSPTRATTLAMKMLTSTPPPS